jgi:galactose mutarotase-like enzyme
LAREAWGEVDGVHVERFVLERGALRAVFTNYGATLLALEVPDRHGVRADVVLGFDTLAEYASPRNPYFGSLVGRCANRIAGARFELDGRVHELAANEGRHHLHGGRRGFDRRVWEAEFEPRAGWIAFERTSAAGEEGYPGELRVRATYRLIDGVESGGWESGTGGASGEHVRRERAAAQLEGDEQLDRGAQLESDAQLESGAQLEGGSQLERDVQLEGDAQLAWGTRLGSEAQLANGPRSGSRLTFGALELEIVATCDAPTLWNPTQHTYWNLAGGGDVSEHVLELAASRYLEVDHEMIPTGRILPVERTPLDLRGRFGLPPHPHGRSGEPLDPRVRFGTRPDPRGRLSARSVRRLGDAIAALARTPAGGVDHAFALDDGNVDEPRTVCTLAEPRSGRVLEIAATQPCLQVYTSNRLGASCGASSTAAALRGKGGRLYTHHSGVCLEAQGFPDAIHHAQFPSVVLRPGERWYARTIWRLAVAK